jgi:uncharacterized protein (DUF1501 family)
MADKTVNGKAPKLVVLQLTGANDYLNTVVPYTNPLYYDNRPNMHIPAEQVQPIDDTIDIKIVLPRRRTKMGK